MRKGWVRVQEAVEARGLTSGHVVVAPAARSAVPGCERNLISILPSVFLGLARRHISIPPAGLPAVTPSGRVPVVPVTILGNHEVVVSAAILVMSSIELPIPATIPIRASVSISTLELLLSISTFELAMAFALRQARYPQKGQTSDRH